MKNKFFIRALIASLFAFMLYSASLRQLKTAKVKIIEPKTSQVKKKQTKEPQIKGDDTLVKKKQTAKDIKVAAGSNKSLVQKIEQTMGQGQYQIAVQDLNNSAKYAQVATSSGTHSANSVLRLLLLIGLYQEEQSGKFTSRTSIKVEQQDHVKGEKLLSTNMMYGVAYLRQAMMRGSKTAANVLLRKIGSNKLNQLAQKFGTKQTKITGNFNKAPVGQTTAQDLNLILKGLYQGKVLNRQHAQLVLTAMHNSKNPLSNGLSGTVYSIADANFSCALVQTNGHSYCISVWTDSNAHTKALAQSVDKWFEQNR